MIRLKEAEIVPIYKSGEKHNVSNYRPISLVSNIAKIFERLLYIRIIDFIDSHNIISKHQFGFMKKIGTKNVLNYLSNILYNNLDKSTPTLVTFLDLAKAFDTVNHQILLDKLYYIGIRGLPLDLLASYLLNGYQKVRINNAVSDDMPINIGVPQGTILGPLLFILYINDLLKEIPYEAISSYADDTAIIATGKSWSEVQKNMNEYLSRVDVWLELNKLSLNVDKTVYMAFGNYRDSVPMQTNVAIRGKQLTRVDSCKYLGIIFYYNMRWDYHIQHVVKKTKYLVYIFYKISKFMSTEIMRMIYYAFFHSIVSYGILIWGGVYNNNRILLENLQKRILKIVNKNNFIVQDNPFELTAIVCL